MSEDDKNANVSSNWQWLWRTIIGAIFSGSVLAAIITLHFSDNSKPPKPNVTPPDNRNENSVALCSDIEKHNNVQKILNNYENKPLIKKIEVRTIKPTNVRRSYGGDLIGIIPANNYVRVICIIDSNFVVIKEKNGDHDGVVEIRSLEAL